MLPANDPDLPKITEPLRLSLSARNPDFQNGVFNADSSVEALDVVKSMSPDVSTKLTDRRTDEALATLDRHPSIVSAKAPPTSAPASGANCWR